MLNLLPHPIKFGFYFVRQFVVVTVRLVVRMSFSELRYYFSRAHVILDSFQTEKKMAVVVFVQVNQEEYKMFKMKKNGAFQPVMYFPKDPLSSLHSKMNSIVV